MRVMFDLSGQALILWNKDLPQADLSGLRWSQQMVRTTKGKSNGS